MYSNVEFDVSPGQILFATKVDGDRITLRHLELTADQAAAIAYLINSPDPLKIEIKKDIE